MALAVASVLSACGSTTNDPALTAALSNDGEQTSESVIADTAALSSASPDSTVAAMLGEPQSGALAVSAPAADTSTTTAPPSTTEAAPTTPSTMAPSTAPETTAPADPTTTTTQPSSSAPPTEPTEPMAQIVEFRIPAGTGSGAWNTFDNPVQVQVGQTLRIHNDDDRAHTLHANGSPVKHGKKINPGEFQDHPVLSAYQPVEGSSRLYEHGGARSAAFWVVAQ